MFPLRRFLALLALLFNLAPAVADDVVKVGVLAFRPKLQTQEQWQPLAAALQARMPERRFEIQVFTYPELNAAVAARQLDFVLTNPGHYVLLSRKFSLSSPIATLLNSAPGGTSLATFGGVIITRADSPVQTLADVRGRRIAAVDSESLGGYQIQAYELKESGLPLPSREQMVLTGAPHDKVIAAVLDGSAEVGFVRTGMIEKSIAEGRLDGKRLRIVNPQRVPSFPLALSTRLYPEWPFAALHHVDAELSGHVAAALLTLGDTPAVLQAMNIRGFVIPVDYTPVVDLLRSLRMPPFDAQPEVTLADIVSQYRGELLTIAGGLLLILILYVRLLQTQRQLRQQNQAMSSVLWGTGVGTWEWNVQTGETRFNERWAAILGYTLAELQPTTIDTWSALLHPEDAQRSAEQLRCHFAGECEHYECEVRVRHKDGHWVWIMDRGRVTARDRDGKPLWMAGTHLEIGKRKAAEEKLAHYQQNLERLVEQRTRDLSLAKEAAEAASRAKTAFLANVSHELRTPMHGIMGMLTLVMRRTSDEKSLKNLQVAEASARRLLGLVSNVLDIARMEGDKLSLAAQPFDLGSVGDSLQAAMADQIADKGLKFSLELPPVLRHLSLSGDRMRLEQVLLNLLGNALTYTSQGGIDLLISPINEEAAAIDIHFAVRDTGVGIPEKDQGRIFQAFEQGDNSMTRQYGGTGLGLAISHRLVRLMGGEMHVVSQTGAGSIFSFTLRFPKVAAVDEAGAVPLATPA
jgi:PAS domain S-box-containing protein